MKTAILFVTIASILATALAQNRTLTCVDANNFSSDVDGEDAFEVTLNSDSVGLTVGDTWGVTFDNIVEFDDAIITDGPTIELADAVRTYDCDAGAGTATVTWNATTSDGSALITCAYDVNGGSATPTEVSCGFTIDFDLESNNRFGVAMTLSADEEAPFEYCTSVSTQKEVICIEEEGVTLRWDSEVTITDPEAINTSSSIFPDEIEDGVVVFVVTEENIDSFTWNVSFGYFEATSNESGLPLWAWIGIGAAGVAVLGGIIYCVIASS